MPCHREVLPIRWSCLAALIFVFALSAGAVQAKTSMPRAERHESRLEIDQLENTWREALVHHNVQAMDSLLAEDYIAITANGTLQSKEQTLANMRNGTLRFNSIDISDRKVRFYGQTALVTSRAEVDGNVGDGMISGSFRYTRVYVRDDKGNWKIVSFEASRIRQPGERK